MTLNACDYLTGHKPSEFPGPVKDEEILVRSIFDPIHFENGTLTNAAIEAADLATRGWSVDRLSFTTISKIHERALRKIQEKEAAGSARYSGQPQKSHVCTGDVRQIRDGNGEVAFRVMDAPIADNDAHAMIFANHVSTPSYLKGLKDLLMPFVRKEIGPFPQPD